MKISATCRKKFALRKYWSQKMSWVILVEKDQKKVERVSYYLLAILNEKLWFEKHLKGIF